MPRVRPPTSPPILSVSLGLLGTLGACQPLPQAAPMQAVIDPEPGYGFEAEEQAYLDELDRLRGEATLDPVDRVGDPVDDNVIDQTMHNAAARGGDFNEVLVELLGHFSGRTNLPFTAHTYVVPQLDGWTPQFPDDLLTRPRVAAVVTILGRPGHFGVLVFFADLDSTP